MIFKKQKCETCNGVVYNSKFARFISDTAMRVFYIIGIFFSTLTVLYFLVTVSFLPADMLSGTISRSMNTYARDNAELIREVAINLTQNCDGNDAFCHAKELFYNLKDIRYVPSEDGVILYDPLYVYKNGGDCRNLATMYVAMMKSLGFDGKVVCKVEEMHCVAVIPNKQAHESNYEKNIIVDLTGEYFVILPKAEDVWSYDE